jgi:hypothetical protein
MTERPSFFGEPKRRNVWRTAVLYIGAIWVLAQRVGWNERSEFHQSRTGPKRRDILQGMVEFGRASFHPTRAWTHPKFRGTPWLVAA